MTQLQDRPITKATPRASLQGIADGNHGVSFKLYDKGLKKKWWDGFYIGIAVGVAVTLTLFVA